MTYKNTYKFLQNVLELEDVRSSNELSRSNNELSRTGISSRSDHKMKGGSITSKYVRREEYDELVREIDKLKCQLESIQMKKNMKGGGTDDVDKSINSVDEYELTDVVPENEKPKTDIKEDHSLESFSIGSSNNTDINTSEQGKTDSSSSSIEEEEFIPTLEGGADANDILKELADFNNYYVNSVKESKPVLKGGFEVSSNQYNWYPY